MFNVYLPSCTRQRVRYTNYSLAEIALATEHCLPSVSEAAPRVLDGCLQPFDPGPLLTEQILLAALRELAEEHGRMLPEQR